MEVIAGKYKVIKVLGQGGFGKVLLAEHLHLNAKYAIKLLNEEISQNKDLIERFKREAEVLMAFIHPGSVQLRDFGLTEDGHYYMAMDYCEGKPLSDILKEEGPMPFPRALNLMIQALQVFEAAHGKGIIHRDIKPANMMVIQGKEGEEILKVLDFGIAKLTSRFESEQMQTLTTEGALIGTPTFISPEQAQGEKNLDHRSDIYSLGVTLYVLLSGRPPFQGDTAISTILQHINEPPPPLTSWIPQLPKEVEEIVIKAMSKKPEDRFQSASEFREACYAALTQCIEKGYDMMQSMEEMGTLIQPLSSQQKEKSTESGKLLQAATHQPAESPSTLSAQEMNFTKEENPPSLEGTSQNLTEISSKGAGLKHQILLGILGGFAAFIMILIVFFVLHNPRNSKNKNQRNSQQPGKVQVSFLDLPTYLEVKEPDYLLAGKIKGKASEVRCDKKRVKIQNQRFELPLKLKEGENLFFLEIWDTDKKRAEKKITIFLDSKGPNIVPKILINDYSLTNKETISISLEAFDKRGVEGFLINGSPYAPTIKENQKASLYIPSFPIKQGRNLLIIQAKDKKGNLSDPLFKYVYRITNRKDCQKLMVSLCRNRRFIEAKNLVSLAKEKKLLPEEVIKSYEESLDAFPYSLKAALSSQSIRVPFLSYIPLEPVELKKGKNGGIDFETSHPKLKYLFINISKNYLTTDLYPYKAMDPHYL
ncbi:MAG: serine/threonine protein kinase, partial [Planctomycetota bacterium]